jgi:hypothetical protein
VPLLACMADAGTGDRDGRKERDLSGDVTFVANDDLALDGFPPATDPP